MEESKVSSLRKKVLPAVSLTLGLCAFVGVFHSDYIFSENEHRVGQVKRAVTTTEHHDHGMKARSALSVSELLTTETNNTESAPTILQLNWQDELTKRDNQIVRMQTMMEDMQKKMEATTATTTATTDDDDVTTLQLDLKAGVSKSDNPLEAMQKTMQNRLQDELSLSLRKRDNEIAALHKMMRDMQKNMEVLQRQVADLTAASGASSGNPNTIAIRKPVVTKPVAVAVPPANLYPNKTLTYENYLRATNFSAPPLPTHQNKLDACLIHVGKTAGSTISCVVGNIGVPSCMPRSEEAKEFAHYRNHSQLARLISRTGAKKNWRHLRSNRCELNPEKKHLVVTTTRDPITRLVSAFHYEQKGCHKTPTRHTMVGCKHIYEKCYSDMESLAATGLKEALQHNNQSLPQRAKDMTCPQRALGFVSGTRDFWRFNHHWYNYEFYLPFLLFPSNGDSPLNNNPLWRNNRVEAIDIALDSRPTHRVVALRNEHLVQDWGSVESLLGGNETIGKNLFEIRLNSSTKKTLSKEALHYLCQALCVDIQYYKLTLWWSSNLQAEDIETSMSTLRESCPEEPSHIRRCGNMPNTGRHKEDPYNQRGPLSVSLGVGKPRLKAL